MLIDRSLYSIDDVELYYRGCCCIYDGEGAFVTGVYKNDIVLSSGDKVKFTDEALQFIYPYVGAHQVGSTVYLIRKDTDRQRLKGFVLDGRHVSILHEHTSFNNMESAEVILSLATPKNYTYAEAYNNILSGKAVAHKITPHFYLSCSDDGRYLELYSISQDHPIGAATGKGIALYKGAEFFRYQLGKIGVEVVDGKDL